MRFARLSLLSLVAIACIAAPLSAVSAAEPARARGDRLFLSFIEYATIVINQWWECKLGVLDRDRIDVTQLRGLAAFRPWPKLEVGGTVGFGETDNDPGLPEGSGATDFDLWGKYDLGRHKGTQYAVGGVLTIPTGDDTAGLGFDAFGIPAFGTLRRELQNFTLSLNGGVRFNGDGSLLGSPDIDGETSLQGGIGLIYPASDEVSLVGELRYEGERFENFDADTRIGGGINWRVSNRGIVRALAAAGLTDGAPDLQVELGYAFDF